MRALCIRNFLLQRARSCLIVAMSCYVFVDTGTRSFTLAPKGGSQLPACLSVIRVKVPCQPDSVVLAPVRSINCWIETGSVQAVFAKTKNSALAAGFVK